MTNCTIQKFYLQNDKDAGLFCPCTPEYIFFERTKKIYEKKCAQRAIRSHFSGGFSTRPRLRQDGAQTRKTERYLKNARLISGSMEKNIVNTTFRFYRPMNNSSSHKDTEGHGFTKLDLSRTLLGNLKYKFAKS